MVSLLPETVVAHQGHRSPGMCTVSGTSQGFGDDDLAAFASLRFMGDVWAVPEGRVVFAEVGRRIP
jgi:hypothetical protein